MSLNKIRRIVSGKKSRFQTEDGVELDLCYITDRILICGWPASGIASLYRNDRNDVRSFLHSRYGTAHYRIFNFVPRFENEYDAGYFDNQVSRFPFPDHHPCPLSMIPLVTRRMNEWLSEHEDNVIVIHCKAGKGRSGTMAVCFLLSLPTLPSPPKIRQNISKKAQLAPINGAAQVSGMPSSASERSTSKHTDPPSEETSDEDEAEVANELVRPQSGGAALDMTGHRGDTRQNNGKHRMRELVEAMASSGDETGDTDTEEDAANTSERTSVRAADKEAKGMADKLQHIFDLHTAQRMKPQEPLEPAEQMTRKKVRGVSIASQRRFVRYWSRVLTKSDPRPLDLLAPPNPSQTERKRRQVRVTAVRVHMPDKMPGLPTFVAKRPISVHLARYRTSFVDSLEERELQVRILRKLERKVSRHPQDMTAEEETQLRRLIEHWKSWRDGDWEDKYKMFEAQGSLTERDRSEVSVDNEPAENTISTLRTLLPHQKELVIDADREVQFKLLVGDTGRTHSMLPDVGSLGYMWLIPSFEASSSPTLDDSSTMHFTTNIDSPEIDFFKAQSGIQRIEIDMDWVVI